MKFELESVRRPVRGGRRTEVTRLWTGLCDNSGTPRWTNRTTRIHLGTRDLVIRQHHHHFEGSESTCGCGARL